MRRPAFGEEHSIKTIAHISDLHFGREDPVIVEALLEALHAAEPDIIVVSGDLTQRAQAAVPLGTTVLAASAGCPARGDPGQS